MFQKIENRNDIELPDPQSFYLIGVPAINPFSDIRRGGRDRVFRQFKPPRV